MKQKGSLTEWVIDWFDEPWGFNIVQYSIAVLITSTRGRTNISFIRVFFQIVIGLFSAIFLSYEQYFNRGLVFCK